MSSYFYWKFESIRKNTCRIVFLLVFAIIFKTSSLIWDLYTLLYGIAFLLDQIKFIYGSFSLAILYPIARTPLCTGWLH
jgi:hypothetical protein